MAIIRLVATAISTIAKVGEMARTTRIDASALNDRARRAQMPKGMTVIVLKPGIYNDENHKANDFADVGDVITVASGPYFSALVEEGKVSVYDSASFLGVEDEVEGGVGEGEEIDLGAEQGVTLEEIEAETSSRHAPRWEDLKAAGITDQAAMSLYKAGIRNQKDVKIIMAQPQGEENLLALKSVGAKTVESLFAWAEEWEE